MPREFGKYNPKVPLGVTWEDSFTLIGDDGNPVNLTGFDVRAQVRKVVPRLSALVALPPAPLFEITTAGWYTTPPAWPVVAGFSIPDVTSGQIFLFVSALDTYLASPTNVELIATWDVRLVSKGTGYVIPLVTGDKLVFAPGVTVP